MEYRFNMDPETGLPHIYMKKATTIRKRRRPLKQLFPRGWNEKRVKQVIDYYDRQSEDDALAEYKAAMRGKGQTMMMVPTELVPEICRLIASRRRRGA